MAQTSQSCQLQRWLISTDDPWHPLRSETNRCIKTPSLTELTSSQLAPSSSELICANWPESSFAVLLVELAEGSAGFRSPQSLEWEAVWSKLKSTFSEPSDRMKLEVSTCGQSIYSVPTTTVPCEQLIRDLINLTIRDAAHDRIVPPDTKSVESVWSIINGTDPTVRDVFHQRTARCGQPPIRSMLSLLESVVPLLAIAGLGVSIATSGRLPKRGAPASSGGGGKRSKTTEAIPQPSFVVSSTEARFWACPMAKYNRVRYEEVYNSCTARPGFPQFKRVLPHLKEVHSNRLSCKTCRQRFSKGEKDQLEKHVLLKQCEAREETMSDPEWLTPDQEAALDSISYTGTSHVVRWRDLYRTLFPADPRGEDMDPYYDYLKPTHKLPPTSPDTTSMSSSLPQPSNLNQGQGVAGRTFVVSSDTQPSGRIIIQPYGPLQDIEHSALQGPGYEVGALPPLLPAYISPEPGSSNAPQSFFKDSSSRSATNSWDHSPTSTVVQWSSLETPSLAPSAQALETLEKSHLHDQDLALSGAPGAAVLGPELLSSMADSCMAYIDWSGGDFPIDFGTLP